MDDRRTLRRELSAARRALLRHEHRAAARRLRRLTILIDGMPTTAGLAHALRDAATTLEESSPDARSAIRLLELLSWHLGEPS